MYQDLEIHENTVQLIEEAEMECREEFRKIDRMIYKNSLKVLSSFHKNEITESHFNATTGYGYSDLGREGIEEVLRLIAPGTPIRNGLENILNTQEKIIILRYISMVMLLICHMKIILIIILLLHNIHILL